MKLGQFFVAFDADNCGYQNNISKYSHPLSSSDSFFNNYQYFDLQTHIIVKY